MPKAFMIRKLKSSDYESSHSGDKEKRQRLDSEHATRQTTLGLWANKQLLFQKDSGKVPQLGDGNAAVQHQASHEVDARALLPVSRTPGDSEDVAERPAQHCQQAATWDWPLVTPERSVSAAATMSSGRVSPASQVLSYSSFPSSSCLSSLSFSPSSSSSAAEVESPTSSLSRTRTKETKVRSSLAPLMSTSPATKALQEEPLSVLPASEATLSSMKLSPLLRSTTPVIDGRCVHICSPQTASSVGRGFNGPADLGRPPVVVFGNGRQFPVCPSPCTLHAAPTSPCSLAPTPPCVFTLPPAFGLPCLPGTPAPSIQWPISDAVYHPVPVPHRMPMVHRRAIGLYGVVTPEEVPSLPESAVSDMPSSPLLRLRSPGPERHLAFSDPIESVDVNNNDSDNPTSKAYNSSCRKEAVFDSGSIKGQNFKALLERAQVCVETVNDGKGVKNPLLSPDRCRPEVDTESVGFWRMGTFHSCPVCSMKCDTLKLLHKHVSTHKDIKRYLCSFCGKGFNDTFDLKRHTRTHTGVKPYKCDSCGKAFTQRCSLESHCRKIHGQNLPFAFNERRTKIYVCEECGHSTCSPDNHFRHLRAQHPGHPALLKHYDRRQFKFEKDKEGKNGGLDLQKDSAETGWLQSPNTSENLRQAGTVKFVPTAPTEIECVQ